MSTSSTSPGFASLLQDFFYQRLVAQRNASARTVASYRDAFRLLLRYVEARTKKPPVRLTLADLDAAIILGFLDHLERERGNSIRSRNTRLAAIRSFFRYAALCDPTALPTIQRVLAIPTKRSERPALGFLSRDEMEALLAAPDCSTWSGQRDRVMLATFYNTGARVSEIIGLQIRDVTLDRSPCVRIHGKGRKERVVPLWRSTSTVLKEWLRTTSSDPNTSLFPSRRGVPLTRSGVEQRLRSAIAAAQTRCTTLKGRHISPHTLRHTTAMHLLQSGVDITVIALWLGHESPATTHLYVEADLAMKERALKKLQQPPSRRLRYRASDRLLAFLEQL